MGRWMFQQLIVGLDYMHRMVCGGCVVHDISTRCITPVHLLPKGICSRDIKLENTLIRGNPENPVLKICDFGYSKSSVEQSQAQTCAGSIGRSRGVVCERGVDWVCCMQEPRAMM